MSSPTLRAVLFAAGLPALFLASVAPGQAPSLGAPKILGTPVRSHGGAAPEHVEYTRDGAFVLTSSLGETARVFDAATGKLTAECKGKGLVERARWCGPAQEFVAVAFDGDGLRVFERATGKPKAAFAGSKSLAVAPDGRSLAVTKGKDLVLLDLAGKPKLTVPIGVEGGKPRFAQDGKQVFVATFAGERGFETVEHVVDVALKKVVGQQPGPGMQKRVDLPDGSATFEVRGARLVKLALPGEEELAVHRLPFGPTGIVLRRGGAEAVLGSLEGAIAHVDLESGRVLQSWHEHTGMVNRLALSPDEQQLVSAAADGTVRFRDLASGEPQFRSPVHDNVVVSVAFAADGQTLASGALDNTAVLWARDGTMIARQADHAHAVTAVAVGPTGLWSLSRDNSLALTDRSGAEVERLALTGKYAFGLSAAVASDANVLVTGHRDGTVQWRDLRTGAEIRRGDHHVNGVPVLVADAGGTVVVSGGVDGHLVIWDTDAAAPRHKVSAHEGGVVGACLATGGVLLSCGNGRELKRWDLAQGALLQEVLLDKDGGDVVGVAALASRGLAVVARTDRLLLCGLGDLAPAGEVPIEAGIAALAASPDGTALAAGLADGTVALWDLRR